MIYAVIDTNVLVSAMITKNMDSPTVSIIDAIFNAAPKTDVSGLYSFAAKKRKFIIVLVIISFEQDPKRDSYGYEAILLSELKEEIRQCDRRIYVSLVHSV